jgi:transposase InsO family protein
MLAKALVLEEISTNGVKLCFSRPGKPTDNAYIIRERMRRRSAKSVRA